MSEFSSGQGIFTSLKRLATNLVGIVETRGSLFVTELHEEKLRVIQILVWIVLTVVLGALGLVLATLLVVVALWHSAHLVTALAAVAAVYLLAAVAAACFLVKTLNTKSKPFEETLNQLRKDRECLGR